MTEIKSHNTDAHFEKLLRASLNILLAPEYQQNINKNQTSIETQGSSDPVLIHYRDFFMWRHGVSNLLLKCLLTTCQMANTFQIIFCKL